MSANAEGSSPSSNTLTFGAPPKNDGSRDILFCSFVPSGFIKKPFSAKALPFSKSGDSDWEEEETKGETSWSFFFKYLS